VLRCTQVDVQVGADLLATPCSAVGSRRHSSGRRCRCRSAAAAQAVHPATSPFAGGPAATWGCHQPCTSSFTSAVLLDWRNGTAAAAGGCCLPMQSAAALMWLCYCRFATALSHPFACFSWCSCALRMQWQDPSPQGVYNVTG
jgi:hypothetical protein